MVEDFVESAYTLRSCDGDRLLLVHLDDLASNYAKPSSLVIRESLDAEIAKQMQWYLVMTVAYSTMY
jgi:predicted DNA-binding protein